VQVQEAGGRGREEAGGEAAGRGLAASPPPVRKASGFPAPHLITSREAKPRARPLNGVDRKAGGFPHGRRQSRDTPEHNLVALTQIHD